MKNSKFKPGTKITIFFIFFSIVFIGLGVWQVERGQSKSKILQAYNSAGEKDPQEIQDNSNKWQRVSIEGKFDGKNQILIDNVIHKGIAGYKVLTPFISNNIDKIVLVDRGWVSAGNNRSKLPDISVSESKVEVYGTLDSPELGFVLSDKLITKDWPKVSQSKNIGVLKEAFDYELFSFILIAEPTLKDSLEYIKITPTNMMPSKHYGYALQWFTMFLALCFMYVWVGRKI
jgi:surfeit locus 1 family protein